MAKDEIRPLKDILEIIKNKVDKVETFQNVIMQQVRDIKDQQSVINEKLDEIQETQDAHTGALITDVPPEFRLQPLPEAA